MQMLEVRCCCRPTKLLGYLPSPDNLSIGQSWTWTLLSWPPKTEPTAKDCDRVTLTLSKFVPVAIDGHHLPAYLAFKAEGMTIERLREIPAFTEAR